MNVLITENENPAVEGLVGLLKKIYTQLFILSSVFLKYFYFINFYSATLKNWI